MATDAELLTAYRQALRAHEGAERAVNATSKTLQGASAALAAALIPTSAVRNDRIGIYVGNDLVVLQANGTSGGDVLQVLADVRPQGVN